MPTTTSPHYPRLPITFTPTPAGRPAFEPEAKRSASEPQTGRNNGYKGYDLEEHGSGYYQGPPPPAVMPSSSPAAVTTSIAFRAEDIGYFDPHLDDAYGKDVYYRDVHLFLGQAESIATIKGAYLIRTNLHICLCGSAQQWYVADLQRDSLHGGLSLDNWIETLTARFKQSE